MRSSFKVVPALLAAIACAKAQPQSEEARKAQDAAPVAVKTAQVEQRAMPRFLVVTGSLRAQQEADVAADASGRVVELLVERGTVVKAGDPLVRLDTGTSSLAATQAGAQAEQARANAEFAKQECERADTLFQQQIIPKAEYDRRKTACSTTQEQVRAAQAGAALARRNVSNATVRAPFTGVVAERFVTLGQFVNPASRIATVVAVDPLRLEASVPEVNVGAVKRGLPVEFLVAAYPDELFSGTVKFVSPIIRPQSRDLVIEAVVPNKDGRLRAGMFAEVKLRVGDENVPVAPQNAVRKGEVASSVFAVVDGHAEERVVQTGEQRDGVIALRAGVKSGEKLIVDPGERVRDGVRVTE
jgi:membrane fusion protein, multidrug efflux system